MVMLCILLLDPRVAEMTS